MEQQEREDEERIKQELASLGQTERTQEMHQLQELLLKNRLILFEIPVRMPRF